MRATTMPQGLALSLLLHAFFLGLLAVNIPNLLPEPNVQAIQIKLVTAPDVKKVISQKKPKKVKTQQGAAPKEAPKPKEKPLPTPKPIKKDVVKAAAPKEAVKTIKTPEPVPLPPVPEVKSEPIPEMRPEKLDKTPDKKNVLASKDKDAETVEDPDDFLAALDFIKDLEAKNSALEEAAEETAPDVVYDAATNAYAGKIKKVVNRNWYRPPGLLNDNENYAVAIVTLADDGFFKRPPYIKESSENRSYDNSLLRGIKKSVPFPVLEKIPPEGVTFELRFGNFGNKQ